MNCSGQRSGITDCGLAIAGTCAHGVLCVAFVQLPLSQQEEVICLSSSPGVVYNTIIWRRCIFLKQPSKSKGCLDMENTG